jgi:hypothetical protein
MNAPAPRRSPIPDWAVEAIETQQRQLFTIAAILQVLEAACASGAPRFDHVPAVVADVAEGARHLLEETLAALDQLQHDPE